VGSIRTQLTRQYLKAIAPALSDVPAEIGSIALATQGLAVVAVWGRRVDVDA
jgi:hypothetical protein